MDSSTRSGRFDESKHPRGQADNPGKFKSKPVPTPPTATPRRRRAEAAPGVEPSDEAMALAMGFVWDEIEIEMARPTNDAERSDDPDPVEGGWHGVNCADCGQPMDEPERTPWRL